jgi:hypothetical protein
VQFDRETLRNPPHAHSANRLPASNKKSIADKARQIMKKALSNPYAQKTRVWQPVPASIPSLSYTCFFTLAPSLDNFNWLFIKKKERRLL